MATGGMRNWKDAVEMILCGANLVGICTETLLNGYDIVRPMIKGLKDYMDSHAYSRIDDFCGKLVPEIKSAPELTLYDGYAAIIDPKLCGEKCGLCKKICCEFAPENTAPDTIVINRDLCAACGMCFHRCPRKNIRMVSCSPGA